MNCRILGLGAALVLLTISPAHAVSEASLESAGSFALGGVGVAGIMSGGERALREMLKNPDAVSQLEALLPKASPAGKLYALIGLRTRDRAAYERALAKCRGVDEEVRTMRGCILGQEKFRDLVKEIERGQYDSFLERERPKEAR